MQLSEQAKEARRAYQREWRAKNKEHVRAYHKEWREKNPEKWEQAQANYWERKANRRATFC